MKVEHSEEDEHNVVLDRMGFGFGYRVRETFRSGYMYEGVYICCSSPLFMCTTDVMHDVLDVSLPDEREGDFLGRLSSLCGVVSYVSLGVVCCRWEDQGRIRHQALAQYGFLQIWPVLAVTSSRVYPQQAIYWHRIGMSSNGGCFKCSITLFAALSFFAGGKSASPYRGRGAWRQVQVSGVHVMLERRQLLLPAGDAAGGHRSPSVS